MVSVPLGLLRGEILCEQERAFGLAKILAQRLHQYVGGDEEGFVSNTREVATRLARLPFGVPLLHRIGYIPWSRAHAIVESLCATRTLISRDVMALDYEACKFVDMLLWRRHFQFVLCRFCQFLTVGFLASFAVVPLMGFVVMAWDVCIKQRCEGI